MGWAMSRTPTPQTHESGKPSSSMKLRGMPKCSFGLSANVGSVYKS